MDLYAELRQHGWLKKLFTARRKTDLLPLAQVLLALSDELTRALLPGMWQLGRAEAGRQQLRWQSAGAIVAGGAAYCVGRSATGLVDLAGAIGRQRSAGRALSPDDAAGRRSRLAPLFWIAANRARCVRTSLSACLCADTGRARRFFSIGGCLPPALARAWPELAVPDG